jgi:hypothetical protein
MMVEGQDLVVALSWLEKLGAFRGNVRVPLRAVRSAEPEPDPWGGLRGIRAPGTGIPGVIALGTRRFDGGKDFAAVRGGRPAVRVDLGDGSPFGRLVVSVDDPGSTVAAILSAAGI